MLSSGIFSIFASDSSLLKRKTFCNSGNKKLSKTANFRCN